MGHIGKSVAPMPLEGKVWPGKAKDFVTKGQGEKKYFLLPRFWTEAGQWKRKKLYMPNFNFISCFLLRKIYFQGHGRELFLYMPLLS